MKCQKCSKPAMVHLTEVVADAAGVKRAVEIHLCLGHAAEAGLVVPGSEFLPQLMTPPHPPQGGMKKETPKGPASVSSADTGLPTSIVPTPQAPPGGLTVVRGSTHADPSACPICGTTWAHFKQSGLMGCPNDYELFESKLLPLLKRAQEGSTDHIGKVPTAKKSEETDRQVTSLRLRRELQKAVDAENYEQAARLRDQLRTLERN